MSQKQNKAVLREQAIRLMNYYGVPERHILEFMDVVSRVRDPYAFDTLTDVQIKNVFKAIETCDTAVAFGKGHQSTSRCDIRGPHDNHHSRSYGIEWTDKDISEQTHTDHKGKTYRLAFSDEGWY